MKNIVTFLIAVFVLAFSLTGFAAGPFTEGALTNPAINTIIADTGPRPTGGKTPAFVVCSTVASVVVLEYRDATNTTNLYSQVFAVPTSSCFYYLYPLGFDTLTDERMRLRLNSAIVGSIQASLFD